MFLRYSSLRDAKIAGRGALVDGMQQAGAEPLPTLVVGVDIERTGAELEDFLQHLDRPAKLPWTGERPVKLRIAAFRLAGELHAGKILANVDFQVGERFAVAQIAVVLGENILDEPGFHQQGVDFALRFEKVDIADFPHESGRALIFGGRLEEIAARPARRFFALPT